MSATRSAGDEPGWKAFTPDDSPMTPDDFVDDRDHQDRHTTALVAGGRAFGFRRERYCFSAGSEPDGVFDLFDVTREKPVALAFGSHT